MRITRRLAILLLSAVLSVAPLGCGSNDAPTPAATEATPAVTVPAATATPVARTTYPLSLTGSDGRSITLQKAPTRMVSLSPGHTEILFAIGAGGQVVGTDRFSDYPEAAKALPKVEYSNTNLEALVALRPDLVLATTRQRNLVATFEQAGLRVLFLEEPASVTEVISRVRLLGEATDHPSEAHALAGRLQARVDAVVEQVRGMSIGPRVYHEVDPKLYSAAPNSFVGDIYTLLKAQNIAANSTSPFPQLAAEAIIRADPEVIVLGDSQLPGGTPEEVKRRPGWDVITAVKQDRVYAVEPNLVSRPGPRVVDGLEQVARHLYPERFR